MQWRQRCRSILLALLLTLALLAILLNLSAGKDLTHRISNQIANLKNPKGKDETGSSPKDEKQKQPWIPPPVKDPFLALATAEPPPIPAWNIPKPDLHKQYNIHYGPPLMIGFTRSYPILIQAVVSYITAGWPAEQIYVIENTGAFNANRLGKLSLQNPFFLNWPALKKLGVNVVQTPTLLSFAQLQNFFTSYAHEKNWPYYFWSHQDVLALPYEEGSEGRTPAFNETGYKTLYELALTSLNETISTHPVWAVRWFAYDLLTLVNRDSYTELGGWDSFIPYYIGDCDFYQRIYLGNYSAMDARAGHVFDVSSALDDLTALYRVPGVKVAFTDPNPPEPTEAPKSKRLAQRQAEAVNIDKEPREQSDADPRLAYYRKLKDMGDQMVAYKHGSRGRNTWQGSQQGGHDEAYYYPLNGFADAFNILTEAGRNVYEKKWGNRNCNLVEQGLTLKDQWRVKKADA